MNIARSIAAATLLGLSLSQAACGGDKPEPKQEEHSVLGNVVSRAVVEARQEIREGNISIGEHKGLPKAEISPKGDLLIGGKPVAINDAQRALLLDYRGHIATVAEAGMDIGVQGADLAAKAMGEAVKGILSGKSEQEIEASVEAEAGQIKVAAAKLCGHLPGMLTSQQRLAAALPEFKPYATMTQDDVDDCEKNGHFDSRSPAQEAADAAEEAQDAAQEAADAAQDAASAAQDAAAAAKDVADAVSN